MDRAKRLPNDVNGRPYRLTRGRSRKEPDDTAMKILVTDGMDKTALEQLKKNGHEVVEQFYAPEELGAALKDFDAVVVRSAFYSQPRDLRGPGLRAYFCPAAKVGKNALKPAV